MSAGGIVTAATCQPGLTPADLHLPPGASPADLSGTDPVPARRLFLGGGRDNFIGQCVLDWTEVAWSLASVGLSITSAVRDSCPKKFRDTGDLLGKLSKAACAMDIGQVVYAFGRIALFIAIAMVHCTNELNLQALCTAGISALIAASAALVVTGGAFYIACDKGIKVVNDGGAVPLRIGTAAEAGATRRLAALASTPDEEMQRLVQSYGINITDPRSVPSFDSADSALKALETFGELQARQLGVERQALKERFGDVDSAWASLGFNTKEMPAPHDPEGRSERFVSIMEPVLSAEDAAHVEAAMGGPGAQ